jgi:Xaa-Pro aminopeptidase
LGTDESVLILGDSETNADLYYATGFVVSAPVAYIEKEGRKVLLVSDLEYGRAKAEAKVDEVLSTTPLENKLRQTGEPVRLTSVVNLYLKETGSRELIVPAGFAFAHAERLKELGYALRFRDDPFFPERMVKRPQEIEAIAQVEGYGEEAMSLAADILRRSEVRSGVLHSGGETLTSERLRLEIQKFLLERECQAFNTIVAGGDQGTDPHLRGTGPLRGNETIVIDIFPRSMRTRYWGDLARTFVRGKASPRVKKLHRDVLDAQDLAFSLVRAGAEGQKIHESVTAFFKERGNPNEDAGDKKAGFIHGTGHGLGLEIHEHPKISRVPSKLAAGHVVTVEPGLYYPGTGAVRIEDVVVVTGAGCRNLNKLPRDLEL